MWGDSTDRSGKISPTERAADNKYQKTQVKMLDLSETTFYSIANESLPLDIDEKRLKDIIERAKDFCLMHGEESQQCYCYKPNNDEKIFLGICMRRKTHYDRDALHFAPFVLFPSPFPEKNFDRIVNIQLVVNELFHKVK